MRKLVYILLTLAIFAGPAFAQPPPCKASWAQIEPLTQKDNIKRMRLEGQEKALMSAFYNGLQPPTDHAFTDIWVLKHPSDPGYAIIFLVGDCVVSINQVSAEFLAKVLGGTGA